MFHGTAMLKFRLKTVVYLLKITRRIPIRLALFTCIQLFLSDLTLFLSRIQVKYHQDLLTFIVSMPTGLARHGGKRM
jgi:hypothetical protein